MIENYLRKLGVVPFKNILFLIYHSTVVINPSKFEGRSSTIEQANSMGKKLFYPILICAKSKNLRTPIILIQITINSSLKFYSINENTKVK